MTELRTIENLPNGFTLREVVGTTFLTIANSDETAFYTVFDPVDPQTLYGYWGELATMALCDFRLHDGPRPVLHLGGAGMAVARGLSSACPGLTQTVVDIDRDITGWVEQHYPPGENVEVIYGDARDHTYLAETHPVVIIDTGMGARDGDEYALYKDLVRGVLDAGTDNTVLVNLIEPHDGSRDGSKAIAAEFGEPVVAFRQPKVSPNNTLLGRVTDRTIAALWAQDAEKYGQWEYEVIAP